MVKSQLLMSPQPEAAIADLTVQLYQTWNIISDDHIPILKVALTTVVTEKKIRFRLLKAIYCRI